MLFARGTAVVSEADMLTGVPVGRSSGLRSLMEAEAKLRRVVRDFVRNRSSG